MERVDRLTRRQKRQKTETGELKSRGIRNVEEKRCLYLASVSWLWPTQLPFGSDLAFSAFKSSSIVLI